MVSKKFDIFLSHNSREKSAVEALAYKLRADGLNPWLDKEQLIPGVKWQGGLAEGLRASSTCAVFIGKDDLGNWESEELDVAQHRAANERDFRIIPVLLPSLPDPFDPSPLPPFLISRTWVDFRPGLEDARAFRRLVCAIKGIPPGPEDGGPPIDDKAGTEIVPYLGLNAFDEADTGLFFGRDADVQRLVEKLKAARFLAVIGASGSGKSSLVRAGLVPALRRNALSGSGEWIIRVFRPGARPLAELALQLVQICGDDRRPGALTDMEQELRKDERAMHNAVRLKLASLQLKPEEEVRQRTLLVVDQFEEVFTLCRDDEERARFLDNLLYASAALDGRSVVVLTMRADFYSRCAAHGSLSARIAAHQYLVGPMAEDNLRQAIEEPARLAGLKVEPELLAEMLAEVRNQPGTLPLLEYALLEVWKRRREGRLTLKDYLESGGVKEALSKRAETIYEGLNAGQQEIVRRVMLRLTQPGEGTDDTRRRAKLSELATRDDEREAVAEVVGALADARLLTTSQDEQDRVVDVSHEALIRGWPRLRGWVDEDRAGLRTLLRLNEAAQEWQREKRDKELLYRGTRLAVALEWRTRNEERLNELERGFLTASEKEARRIVKVRWVLGAWVFLSVMALMAWAGAYYVKRSEERQRRLAVVNMMKAVMVEIPGGSFMMGSNNGGKDELPIHKVTLKPFYMSKYEVTQAQWKAVMGNNNNPSLFKGDDLPVENVSWNDAKDFCIKLSEMTGKTYRLPTEAEWEYAARAGSAGDYCFGNNAELLDEYAWYDKNSENKTHPVGQKKPNALGLYDVHGNVWEWCEDDYHQTYEGAPDDGSAWVTDEFPSRLLRGGSWYYAQDRARAVFRYLDRPGTRDFSFGFRVVGVVRPPSL